jgi:hypothetical protein
MGRRSDESDRDANNPEESEQRELTHQAKHVGNIPMSEGPEGELEHKGPDEDREERFDYLEANKHEKSP